MFCLFVLLCSREDESAGPASKKRCLKPAGDVTNEDVFTSLLGSDSTESHASSQSEGGTKETFAVGQIGLSDCRKDVAGGFKLLTIAGAKAAIETDCGLFVLTSEGSQTTLMCFANPAFGREAKKGYSAPQMCWSLACPSPKGGGKVAAGGTNELCYVSTSPWSSSTLSLAQERVKLSSPLVSRLLDLNATLSFQTVVLWAFSDGSVFASASHSITEECKWSLVCHLREPAEAIHPVITCKPADGKPCDLLLVTGRYGRVVAVTERATGVNGPPVLFNEYRIEGPILCSCVIHCRVSSSEVVPCLVWSTGLRLNWARLDICRGSCVNNTPRLTTKALSSAVGVCCLWPKEADGCFGRLCSGEVVCFPVAEPLSTTDLSPAPVVRTRLQEALTALQAASQETNDLVKHESEQNKVLSRLNFILHVFAGLKSVPSLQKEKETSSQRSHNKAFSVNFFPQLKQSLSGMRSAGVCCHVNNHTSQNLFSGWSAVFSVTYRSMRAVRRPAWSVVLSLVGLSGGEARCLWVPVLAPDLFDHLNIACSIHFDVSSLLSGNDPVNVSFESSNVVSPVAYAQLDVLSFASIVDEQGTDCCDVVKAWPLQMMQDIARLSLLEQSTTSSDANGCEDKQHESESLSLLVSPSSLVGAEVAAGAQDIASQIRACLRRLLDGCWFKVTDDSGCVDDDGVVEVSLKTAAGQDILLAAGAVISERSDTFPSDPSDAVQEGTVETLASRETSEPERIVWLTVSACSRQLLCAVHAALVQRAKVSLFTQQGFLTHNLLTACCVRKAVSLPIFEQDDSLWVLDVCMRVDMIVQSRRSLT